MATRQEYVEKIRAVLHHLRQFESVHSIVEGETLLREIHRAQTEVRKIKREINQDMKAVRMDYRRAGSQITTNTAALTLFTKGAWNKGVRMSATMQRQKLMAKRDQILAEYDELKYLIDQEIAELDGLKSSIQAAIKGEKEREKARIAEEKAQLQKTKETEEQNPQKVLGKLTSQKLLREDKAIQSLSTELDQSLVIEEQFRQILRIVLADGVITKEEMIEAEKVRKQLNISSSRAKEILEELSQNKS